MEGKVLVVLVATTVLACMQICATSSGFCPDSAHSYISYISHQRASLI
jgi:hypothetical protein